MKEERVGMEEGAKQGDFGQPVPCSVPVVWSYPKGLQITNFMYPLEGKTFLQVVLFFLFFFVLLLYKKEYSPR